MKKVFIVIHSPKEKGLRFPRLQEEDGCEYLSVRLDRKGSGLGRALRAQCSRGIREVFILKAGSLPESWQKDVLPREIEQVRRDFLDVDLHYLPRH